MREEVRDVERLSHMLEAINVLINYKEHHKLTVETPCEPGVKEHGGGVERWGDYFESILLKNSTGESTGRVPPLKSFLLRVTIQSACSSMAERYWVASSDEWYSPSSSRQHSLWQRHAGHWAGTLGARAPGQPGCWCQRMLASFIVFLVDESINAALIGWYGHAALNREILHKKHGGLALVLNR